MAEIIIVHGPPYSGKSTQSERLTSYKIEGQPIYHVSAGNILTYINLIKQCQGSRVKQVSRSSEKYLKFAIKFISLLEKSLEKKLLLAFIYGSVARGQADTGRSFFETNCYIKRNYVGTIFDNNIKSDIDIAVIVKEPTRFSREIEKIVRVSLEKFSKEMLISVLLFPEDSLITNLRKSKSPDIYKRLINVSQNIVLSNKTQLLEKYQLMSNITRLDIKYERERLKIREAVAKHAKNHKSKIFANKVKIYKLAPIWAKFHIPQKFQKTPHSAFGGEILRIKIPKRNPSSMENINFKSIVDLNSYFDENQIIRWK